MVASFWLKFNPGGCPGNRVMTIFVFYVGPHFPNIQYFDVCESTWRYIKLFGGIWKYMEVYERIWRYIRLYEPTFPTFCFFICLGSTFSAFVFRLFWGPLFRHCFFSGFLRVYRPWEVSLFFSRQISRRMPSESCLGTPWGSSYDQFCKTCVFRKRRKGRGKRFP